MSDLTETHMIEVPAGAVFITTLEADWYRINIALRETARERLLSRFGDKITWAEGETAISDFANAAENALRDMIDPARVAERTRDR